MARTIVGTIEDIDQGETLEITVLCKKNAIAQNITGDTVTLTIKENKSDADSSAILQVDADVATYGATGTAYWNLTPTQTEAIDVGTYYIDVTWYDGTKEHIAYKGTIKVLERISDV